MQSPTNQQPNGAAYAHYSGAQQSQGYSQGYLPGASQGAPQGYPQGSPQVYPLQGASQGYPQGIPQAYPQGVPQTYSQGASQGYPQGAPQAYSSQGVPQAYPSQGAPQSYPSQGAPPSYPPQGYSHPSAPSSGHSANGLPSSTAKLGPGYQPTLNYAIASGHQQTASHPQLSPLKSESAPSIPPPNGFQTSLPQPSGFPNQIAPPAPPPPPPARINPSMVPSPVSVQEADQARFVQSPFYTSSLGEQPPPLPSSRVQIIDDGNGSCRFARLTTYQVPISEDLCMNSRVPLALIVQPMAITGPNESPVPVIDHGTAGPIRCFRCRAYINPFVVFNRGGKSYSCNICGMENEVRDDYFCNLDISGRRADLSMRPELVCGTVDFIATPEYYSRKTILPPRLIFALDSSRGSIQSGSFLAYVEFIKAFIRNQRELQQQERNNSSQNYSNSNSIYSKVAIITFDRAIHFYDVRSSLMEPQMLVMCDAHEPFVPLHDGLFFDPVESSELALSLLDRLPRMFADTRIIESCLGAAASVSFESLKSSGGRVILLQTTLPNYGAGALKNRDGSGSYQATSEKVNPLLVPQGEFYTRLGKQASTLGISFSICCTPSSYIDLATISSLASSTGGTCTVYPKFSYDLHCTQLVNEQVRALSKPFAFDCTLRVRCGSGLETKSYIGKLSTVNSTDYQCGSIDCDQSFAVDFNYDAKLSDAERIGFQAAMLYTTSRGERRVRIINLNVPVTNSIANVFRMADLDAILSYLVKSASIDTQDSALPFVNSAIITKCVQMLAAYRKNCASNMSTGQLVLPDALKLLPLYTLTMIKNGAFNPSTSNVDDRIEFVQHLRDVGIDALSTLLYPRLLALHYLLTSEGLNPSEQDSASGNTGLSEAIVRLSIENIQPNGIYLIENTERMVLWIGAQVDTNLLSSIFGTPSISNINSAGLDRLLPELDNPSSRRLRSILNSIQLDRPTRHLGLQIIRQGLDPSELDWFQLLVEDGQPSNATGVGVISPSYVDFLCRIHGQIQQEINATPSLSERAAALTFMH